MNLPPEGGQAAHAGTTPRMCPTRKNGFWSMHIRRASSDGGKRKDRKHDADLAASVSKGIESNRELSFGSVPVAAVTLVGSGWSFDGVVRRVLGFSRAAEVGAVPRGFPKSALGARTPSPMATGSTGHRAALDALGLFVRTLDQATHDKLETVMRAGRDGRALADAHVLLCRERVAPGYEVPDLFGEGAAALQNLQRGHAVACATGFDLEGDLAGRTAVEGRSSLDERVWLRFGRELALSTPGEWLCLALIDSKKEVLALFLRRGERPWWSFDSMIDRPSRRQMASRRSARSSGRGRLVLLPFDDLVGRRCHTDRKAVRRAALAMSARLGRCRMLSDGAV